MNYRIRTITFLIALVAVVINAKAQTILYHQNFENSAAGFHGFYLYNGDKGIPADASLAALSDSAWVIRYNESLNSNLAIATSNYSPALQADDWLITPAIQLGKASKLSFKAAAGVAGMPDDYTVYISTSQQNVNSCLFNSPLQTFHGEQAGVLTEHTIDLKAAGYASQTVFLGFRLHTLDGGNNLMIGDITVTDDSVTNLVPLTFIVNMSVYISDSIFNPRTDSIDIVGNFNNWTGDQYLLDSMPGSDSLYSITIPGFMVGQHLEFKFRINCSWVDTLVEFPYGQPNRIWNIEEGKYTYTCYYNDEGKTYGIRESDMLMQSVRIFPNPFTDIIQLDVPSQVKRIVITTIGGQGILEYKTRRNENPVMDLSHLPPGMYVVSFYTDRGLAGSRKIIKQ